MSVPPGTDIGAEPYRQLKPGPGRSAAEVTFHQRARIDRAMVEIVAERGYSRTTVREIARVAGISTRAFYEHYSGKEECFLRVHRHFAHGLLRRIEARTHAEGADDRLRVSVGAILEWWSHDWKVARFMLLGSYGAGPAALTQSRLVDRTLGAALTRSLGHPAEGGGGSTGLIANGIIAGLTAAMRSAMLDRGNVQWPELYRELTQWALSCACSPAELDALQVSAGREAPLRRVPSSPAGVRALAPGGDLALIHSATIKLAAADDCDLLTPRRICAAAGVSRRSFADHFSGIDECLVATAGLQLGCAVERARRASEGESTTANRVFRGLAELCGELACDPALVSLCFGANVESGEWLARRDQVLRKSLGGLLGLTGPRPCSPGQTGSEASLGAVAGLLQNEVAAGRARCIYQKAPLFAYLMLAPGAVKSSPAKTACRA